MNARQKGQGFPGQRIVVLPRAVLAQAREQPLLMGLLPTDVGYFPRAKGHLRERKRGVDQAIFIHCTAGEGWCDLAGVRHIIRSGEVLVIPPETPHTYGANQASPWSIHWLHAQGTLIGNFLSALNVTPQQPVLRLGVNTPFLSLFEEVLETVEHGYAIDQLLYAAQTMGHLLAVLMREQNRPQALPSIPAQRIAETIGYMKEHLDQSLQLDTLATLAHLSRSRYSAVFKQQVGYAPIDYFIRLRMHRACQLLDTTDATIKEVAGPTGYEDPLYFSRVFHAVNDLTPTEYRKTRKG